MSEKIHVTFSIDIADEDIEKIIEKAKTGTVHWCSSFERKADNPKTFILFNSVETKYTSGQPGRVHYTLTYGTVIHGITKYITNPIKGNIMTFGNDRLSIDMDLITEEIADVIVQDALFGGVIYKDGRRL